MISVSNVSALGAGGVYVAGPRFRWGVAIVAIGCAKWVWDVNRRDGKDEEAANRGQLECGDGSVCGMLVQKALDHRFNCIYDNSNEINLEHLDIIGCTN